MSKHILLIGVGGTGSHAVDLLYKKVRELGNQAGNTLEAIVFDTDMGDIKGITDATPIPLADARSLGAIVDSLDAKSLEEWFPCYTGDEAARLGKEDGQNYRHQEMHKGAAQWRKKSYLAFVNLMANSEKRTRFEQAIERLVRAGGPDALYEIYTVASLAGGTGSGSFIPISLYAKKHMRKFGVEPRTHAMLACPDIYEPSLSKNPDQIVKVYANAYAILREINAMNQVAFGNNKPQQDGGVKKAPIRFRLGGKDDRYTGLLFDAEDPDFWSPTAIPFHKIYLLDKLVGLSSVKAHDGIMANALYTLLCTDIGLAFDTTDSNLETARSEADRHNAVYAGVSASELRYPLDDITAFMAYKKAEEAAEGEWTTVYRDVEETIAEKQRAAQEMGRPYMMKDGEYALDVNTSAANLMRDYPLSPLTFLLKRGLYNVVMENDKPVEKEFLSAYLASISANLRNQLACDAATALKAIDSKSISKKVGVFASSEAKEAERNNFVDLASTVYTLLNTYYLNAVDVIRTRARSIANSILPMQGDKDVVANKELSLVHNILCKGGKYVHPVAAFVQLCRLKGKLKEMNAGITEWEELRGFEDVYKIPDALVMCESPVAAVPEEGKPIASLKGSAYAEEGERRLLAFQEIGSDGYKEMKSDPHIDSAVLVTDAKTVGDALFAAAERQLSFKVLSVIEARVDILIQQYRAFFRNFDEGRRQLTLDTERALAANDGVEDVMYIGASSQEKLEAYKDYKSRENMSADDMAVIDDITGKSVFATAYTRGCAEVNDETVDEETKTGDLFASMVDIYGQLIRKSTYYKEQDKKGIFQIMVEQLKKKHTDKQAIFNEIGIYLRGLYDKSQPSLKAAGAQENAVILFSTSAAKYLCDNAREIGLPDCGDDYKAAAENFVQNAGIMNINVAVAPKAHRHVLSMTRKIDNVQPMDIDKINENGKDPKYFARYQEALRMKYAQSTDMWNPHLGMEIHKHGYLPYINPDYERIYNEKLAKAVLYAIIGGKISYANLPRSTQKVFWSSKNGKVSMIMHKGQYVSEKNITGILGWLRMEDDLVEEYSAAYDRKVKEELDLLPPVVTKSNRPTLYARITTSGMIKKLRENLFTNVSGVSPEDKRLSLGLLEFAYTIKTNEESSVDCDDAEKILAVGYKTLMDFCMYRVGTELDAVLDVKHQQVQKFVVDFYNDPNTQALDDPMDYTRVVFEWAHANGCFLLPSIDGNEYDFDVTQMVKENNAAEEKKATSKTEE